MPKTVSAHEQPTGRVFSDDYVFGIPGYQRPYAWTADQAGELFDDLVTFMHGHVVEARTPDRAWAELMQRGFGFDVLACPRCSGRLTLIALIRAPDVIGRILRHLHLPDAVPMMRPVRDPPLPLDGFDDRQCRDDF